MATELSNIPGLVKNLYKAGVQKAQTGITIMQDRLGGLEEAARVGDYFNFSVLVRGANGVNYGGSQPASNSSLSLADSIQFEFAKQRAFSMHLIERVDDVALSRAKGDPGATAKLLTQVLLEMRRSGKNRIELMLVRGNKGCGTVESVTDLGSNLVSVVFTEASFLYGLFWAMDAGSKWDAFSGTTKKNSGGALVLRRIASSTRTLVFEYSGVLGTQIEAADVIYPTGVRTNGSSDFNCSSGVLDLVSVVSGTNQGINATTYPSWQGNAYDYTADGEEISVRLLEDAAAQLRDRGASGQLYVDVSSRSYAKLMAEAQPLARFNEASQGKKARQGFSELSYTSKVVGEMTIGIHPFLSDSEFIISRAEDFTRIGSTDLVQEIPGMQGELVYRVPGSTLWEFQMFSDQALMCTKPSNGFYGYGLTP